MKKTNKIIYKLKMQGISIRTIKVKLKEKYNIVITEKYISNIVKKIDYKRVKYTEFERNKILYLYSNFINTKKLVQYLNDKYNYNLTYHKLVDMAHDYGVKKKKSNMYKQSFINRNDEYKIKRMYESGMTAKEISKIYGYKTKESIYSKLDKFNVKKRNWNDIQIDKKTYKNFNLKSMNTNFKAYFLGLMLTDGYINLKRNYIGIELTDIDCIKFICENINSNYKIIDKKDKKLKLKYRITIYGKSYIDECERFGIIEKKTFSTVTPKIKKEEEKFLDFLIRGVIDGDGWIRADGMEFFICSASKTMIFWYKNIMERIGFIDLKVRFIKNEYNGIYQIRSAKKYNIYILKNKIYKNNFGMQRKYNLLL